MRFRKKTRLDKVKEICYNFLEIPPVKSDIEGFANHPFTMQSIFMHEFINDENKPDFKAVSIFSEEGQKFFKECIKELIDSAKTVSELEVLITKPYKTAFLYYIEYYINEEDYSYLLKWIWKTCDYVNVDNYFKPYQFLNRFQSIRKNLIMNEEELKIYNELTKKDLVIYRGSNSLTQHPIVKALSYTTDLTTANKFAKRFLRNEDDINRFQPIRVSVIIPKELVKEIVICYFKEEDEVIVDFRKFKEYQIKVVKEKIQ